MPRTYTLGVWHTPNQIASDMTFQVMQSRKNHKKDLKDDCGLLTDFQGQIPKLPGGCWTDPYPSQQRFVGRKFPIKVKKSTAI